MPVFWKFGGFWINVDHIIAVREMRGRHEASAKYKILLDEPLGELPGEITCEGDEARELLRLLEASRGK